MNRAIVLVENGRGALYALRSGLVRMDLEVLHAADALSARRYLRRTPIVLAIIAVQDLPPERVRELADGLRSITPAPPRLAWVGSSPVAAEGDVHLEADTPTANLLDLAEGALLDAVYPSEVVDLVRRSAQSVLQRAFDTMTFPGTITLLARRHARAPITALLPFSGQQVSGVLAVSGSEEHLSTIFRRLVPGREHATIKEIEDLAGEMANQILGQVKRWFVGRGLDFETTSPMFLRGQLVEVRGRSGQPSLLLPMHEVDGTLFVQFSVLAFEETDSAPDPDHDTLPPGDGELLFL